MITREELHILTLESTREAIERNIERSPIDVALDKKIEHRALVASQVKYLQRSRTKLPSYYAARCIIPSLAFEQSSSEATASIKTIEGKSLLELTCGLGVDTFHLSKRFTRVVTIERNEILAEVARENFRRLGAHNIEVVSGSAEEYLEGCDMTFDWIYADPDRRSEEGSKLVRLEDCSPNMLALKGRLEALSSIGVAIKCSPIFDIDEAFRLYEGGDVEVVSSHDECKEVVIIARKGNQNSKVIATMAEGRSVEFMRCEIDNSCTTKTFDPEQYRWMIAPDVSLQKSRTVAHALRGVADVWSNNGFGFCATEPPSCWGKVYEIEEIVDFQPKALNKRLAKQGVEMLKRDFAIPQSQISKQLKTRAGADLRIALTTIQGRNLAIFLKV